VETGSDDLVVISVSYMIYKENLHIILELCLACMIFIFRCIAGPCLSGDCLAWLWSKS